ncbi:MAG: hypothetical protein ABIJ08_03245, partial [Nanoarchaeota archaeon]
AFGSMAIGQLKNVTGDVDMGTTGAPTIKNQGNAVIDASISATNFDGDVVDSFAAENAAAEFGLMLGHYALTNADRTETALNLATGTSSLKGVSFSLTIPTGALPETYTSTVTITAIANS